MHNLQLRNLLSAVALSALLPLSLTACDDGGSGGSGSGDGSTGGASDTNDTNDAATVTVTDTTPTTVTDTTPTTGDTDPTTGADTTDTEATTGDTDGPTTGDTDEPTTGGTDTTTGDTETTGETDDPTTGGMSECETLTVSDVLTSYYDSFYGIYYYRNDGEISGDDQLPDSFQIQFYDDILAGDVDLTAAPDDNFSSCSTCILHLEDADENGAPARYYFQSAGTLGLSEDASTLTSEMTFTGVRLVEVTIDFDGGTYESTPVMGGNCYDIVDGTSTPVPAGWNCAPETYADGGVCDCGCGLVDPDCMDETAASCDECNGEGSCAADEMGCMTIENMDNSVCEIPGWTCDIGYYDAADGCDCGCGITDPDCADMTLDSCDFCSGDGSCSDQACDGNTQIDAANNAVCQ